MLTDEPSFTCNNRYEVQEGSKFQTECEPQGIPQPVTTWFKNGKEMTTPQHWRKNDSGNYLLMATNEHGTVSYMLDVDVLCKLYCWGQGLVSMLFCCQ